MSRDATRMKSTSLELGLMLRNQLLRREVVIGPWCTLPHPTVIELMARMAYDFLLLDSEHSAIDIADLGALLPAADLHGAPTIFRPRTRAMGEIKAALDAGASGVMVPMIDTVESAREVIKACRYAPLGQRGIGPWRASGFYDSFEEYTGRANEATTLILQIESATGLKNVEQIAAQPGFEALYVGPADLASSLGLPVGDTSQTMRDAIAKVARAAHDHDKIAGIDIGSACDIPELVDIGFSFFTIGSDAGFIQSGGRSLMQELVRMQKSAEVTA